MDSASASLPHLLTPTQTQQLDLEHKVKRLLHAFSLGSPHQHSMLLELWRQEHAEFCLRGLRQLGASHSVLDANRPWLCYWMFHSLALLGEQIDDDLKKRTVDFLSRCQDPRGGYGGGPGQMPHLATTYAAVLCLVTIGGEEALASINRENILDFLLEMKDPCGGFRMHKNGEIDVRGCYTAIVVAHILNLLRPSLVIGVADYISRCQTHEGGIGGEPGVEAHGGYTYCGLATLVLLNQANHIDLPSLLNWAVFRQANVEGGFQGRTNKLVDGCYSFWQGGIFALIQRLSGHSDYVEFAGRNEPMQTAIMAPDAGTVSAATLFPAIEHLTWRHASFESGEHDGENAEFLDDSRWGPLFNTQALQAYILLCCQAFDGGLKDKPGKVQDFYHTCYCLSGLSTAQYAASRTLRMLPPPSNVLGPYDNLLEATHPLCNVVIDKYASAYRYFHQD